MCILLSETSIGSTAVDNRPVTTTPYLNSSCLKHSRALGISSFPFNLYSNISIATLNQELSKDVRDTHQENTW